MVSRPSQTTSNLLLVRPSNFGFNKETALDNAFQIKPDDQQNIQDLAVIEFNKFVELLVSHQIDVTVIDDAKSAISKDAVFPNNWISFHENGVVCLYPMLSEVRRKERRTDIVGMLKERFIVKNVVDLSHFENQNKFLEGTGSLILDHVNKVTYLCLSKRTNLEVFKKFCAKVGSYKVEDAIIFEASDKNNQPIYHTNVVMSVGDNYAIICLESIRNEDQRSNVITSLKNTRKTIIDISMEQMYSFAGNMLQVSNTKGEKFLLMSSRAYKSLKSDQIKTLESLNQTILHTDLTTIEDVGGGSARCMIAEIFFTIIAFIISSHVPVCTLL